MTFFEIFEITLDKVRNLASIIAVRLNLGVEREVSHQIEILRSVSVILGHILFLLNVGTHHELQWFFIVVFFEFAGFSSVNLVKAVFFVQNLVFIVDQLKLNHFLLLLVSCQLDFFVFVNFILDH